MCHALCLERENERVVTQGKMLRRFRVCVERGVQSI